MPEFIEKGTLPLGVEYGGKVHKEFELRPLVYRDSIEIYDSRDPKDPPLGRCEARAYELAKQLIKLGDIPGEDITPELIKGLFDDDASALVTASGRLDKRVSSFFRPKEGPHDAGAGPGKGGGGGPDDASGTEGDADSGDEGDGGLFGGTERPGKQEEGKEEG